MELAWVRTVRKGNRPDLANAAATRETQLIAALTAAKALPDSPPPLEKRPHHASDALQLDSAQESDLVSSGALRSELLGFEICQQEDRTYRAHLLHSDIWGRRWSMASLAVYEGIELAHKTSIM